MLPILLYKSFRDCSSDAQIQCSSDNYEFVFAGAQLLHIFLNFKETFSQAFNPY